MASSVSRWLATFSHHAAEKAARSESLLSSDEREDLSSSEEDSGETRRQRKQATSSRALPAAATTLIAASNGVMLSAQSTLESLTHPQLALDKSSGPSSPRYVIRSSNSPPSSSATTTATATLLSSPSQRKTSANNSLAALFACVSPYLSSADLRVPMPLRRLYDPKGPVVFPFRPLEGVQLHRGELRLWENEGERVVSQNSSNRRVHRAVWISSSDPAHPRPAALKFVEDANPRDGRSLKREIECHIYVYQKLPCLFQLEQDLRSAQAGVGLSFINNPEWSVAERIEDAWPSAELFGYHLDKKNPGRSVLLTRKLSGPDLFDVIRAEHNHNWHFHHPSASFSAANKCYSMYAHRAGRRVPDNLNSNSAYLLSGSARQAAAQTIVDQQCMYYPWNYEYHKLRWCSLALKRIAQYAALSIRHNDVKPDNIVLDFYTNRHGGDCLDVKLIDLGTASMHNAKDFTGGTSWYESPEQKLLEYFMKKRKKPEAAKRVDIDLGSDLWGAGISIAEVLVGRRVVDTLKAPHGPGALEYLGWEAGTSRGSGRSAAEEAGGNAPAAEMDFRGSGGHLCSYPYWAVDPDDWTVCARKALGLDRDNGSDKITFEAARWIFTHLVRSSAETRTPLNVAMGRLERFAEEAYRRSRHVSSSFHDAYPKQQRRSKPDWQGKFAP